MGQRESAGVTLAVPVSAASASFLCFPGREEEEGQRLETCGDTPEDLQLWLTFPCPHPQAVTLDSALLNQTFSMLHC